MDFPPLGYNFKFCSYRLGHQVKQLGLLPLALGCDDHRQSAGLLHHCLVRVFSNSLIIHQV